MKLLERGKEVRLSEVSISQQRSDLTTKKKPTDAIFGYLEKNREAQKEPHCALYI